MPVDLRKNFAIIGALTALVIGAPPSRAQPPPTVLWSIGTHDHSDKEFALAPGGYLQYKTDGVYVVGRSANARTWPYVQPGPEDSWAGSQPHTFRVFFGLAAIPARADFQLSVNLLDTQSAIPPAVKVSAGRFAVTQQLPPGSGDATVFGTSQTGRPSRILVNIPASALHTGENELSITTVTGSWMIYDSVEMLATKGVALQPMPPLNIVSVKSSPWILRHTGHSVGTQTLQVSLWNYTHQDSGTVEMDGRRSRIPLGHGLVTVPLQVPLVRHTTTSRLSLAVGTATVNSRPFEMLPVRHWVVYLIPHSHVDIGYTDLQANVRKKQIANLLQGLQLIRETAHYPAGSRFKWNLEVVWPFDTYLPSAPAPIRTEVRKDIRNGSLGLDAFYGNLLTGLCTTDELLHAFDDGLKLAANAGVKVDAGMQDDVPGNTWGNVSALAQAGVKYLSLGPNPGDRMGQSLIRWQDKPFYWQSQSGRHKVLVWMVHGGYSLGVGLGGNLVGFLPGYLTGLQRDGYPYDITCLQWLSTGDNGSPDVNLAKTVADWNRRYVSPQLIISRTDAPFKALAAKYGSRIPTLRGDFTPYWEDGAGTSALETSLNRSAAARLQQAEALWAMCSKAPFAAAAFHHAWDNTLLYSEHTWGAWDSTSNPDLPFVKSQWRVKRAYAHDANRESRALVNLALQGTSNHVNSRGNEVMVYNTESWPRTEVVFVAKSQSSVGDRVLNGAGVAVPSQRLSDGRLAFLARNVPPFGSSRYTVAPGVPIAHGDASATSTTLTNGLVTLHIDPHTGAISQLRLKGLQPNLVESKNACEVNSYFYLPGGDLKNLATNGTPTVTVLDAGPLVADVSVTSSAPGCNSLTRLVTICSGERSVRLDDIVDKKKVLAYEGIHMGFGFNVPGAVTRMDMPLSVIRPGIDQLPASCMNWYPVQDWVDVSNEKYGVTWATRDAPLVEVGAITAVMPGDVSPTDPRWITHITSSPRIYSWVMNNHWHTNYRAYQYGTVDFRYAIRPHGAWNPADMARFGVGFSHPLLAVPGEGAEPTASVLGVSNDSVIVRELVPLASGHGYLVRLWGASGKTERVSLTWRGHNVRNAYISDTQGQKLQRIGPVITVPGYGLVTLRLP